MNTTFWALVGPLYQQPGGRRPQVRTGLVQRTAPLEIIAGRVCGPSVGAVMWFFFVLDCVVCVLPRDNLPATLNKLRLPLLDRWVGHVKTCHVKCVIPSTIGTSRR